MQIETDNFVARIRAEDFGLPINIPSSLENVRGCRNKAGIKRHSVGNSFGFEGIPENHPNHHVMMPSTMWVPA